MRWGLSFFCAATLLAGCGGKADVGDNGGDDTGTSAGDSTSGGDTSSGSDSGTPTTDSGTSSDSTVGTDTSDFDTFVPPSDGSAFDVVPPDGSTFGGAVYAHSASTLYRMDPSTFAVTSVGDFQIAGGGGAVTDMTDIALDKTGVMYGVTFSLLYRIEYKAGGAPQCTQLATLSTSFNGLTFVPAGMIDPTSEILVGAANDGGWWRIDVASGATSATLTRLGSYGGGTIGSSGDTVGIIGDQVYATVTGLGTDDHVIVVDPKTGSMTKDLGGTGVSGLWGVGYWAGVMYGFSSDGSLYSIDLKTAAATLIPGATKPPGGWWGAGVTTAAPRTVP